MKQIIKNFNNLIKKTIFKVQNKTNNNFKISNFNRYLISCIILLFIYLFYLLIPILYDKTWVQSYIDKKLAKEFRINLSSSFDISYRILPAPHFLIKDSKILINNANKPKSIAEIKKLKVFINQRNLFNKEKLSFKKVIINEANFLLFGNDIKLINKYRNGSFSNKKIMVNDSNIFIKGNLDEVISIIKIKKAILFSNNEKKLNVFKLNGEIFNTPFVFDIEDSKTNKKINLNIKSLKLNILNESIIDNNKSIRGKNIISFLNSTINTKYDLKNKSIHFSSDNSKIKESKINYSGVLSINPFDINLVSDLNDYKISKIFDFNSILIELFKSRILFNENISINTTMLVNSNLRNEIFQNARINFNVTNGKINFDNTKFINDSIGLLELRNSNLFTENNNLVLNTDILIEVKNSKNMFSFFNTSKKFRKNIKNILINLDYSFLDNKIKFNKIEVDNNEVSDQFLTIIDGFSENDFNNLNKSRVLINKLFQDYEG